ncbi:MAG: type II secretion system F family protein [Bacillales bacterium]|jgi:pilus assembly protein TadC|nr:type II secretion system F family protein [Bacillales bacterium]
MKKETFLSNCLFLNINPKKIKKQQYLILVMGFLCSALYYFLSREIYITLVFLLLTFLLFQQPLNALTSKVKKKYQDNEANFSDLISYLIILLDNGFNIYQGLEISKEYVSEVLQKEIEILLSEIDNDKTILPFQNFANKFNSFIVMQISLLLFQLEQEGYVSDYLARFPNLIEKMRENYNSYKLHKRKDEFSIYSLIPLVALLIVIFTFTFAILGAFMGGL